MSSGLPAPNHAEFSLTEVVAATGGVMHLGPGGEAAAPALLQGVVTDTRSVTAGGLFVALRGARFDGHTFLEQAAQLGAAAAVIELGAEYAAPLTTVVVADTTRALGDLARFHRSRFTIPVVGVTGSYGKTTTRAFIAAALGAQLNVLSAAANFNNEIGVPLTLLQLEAKHDAAVIEMGMRGAGQIAELARIARPTVAVVTNVGPQHVELLGGVAQIAAAKAELPAALPADGVAVLPFDDGNLQQLSAAVPAGVRIVTFGCGEGADVRATEIATGADGAISFSVSGAAVGATLRVQLALPGAHNALNAVGALAVALTLGIPAAVAAGALAGARVPGGRMRIVQAHGITIIDDSYNAGPDSMRAALHTLRDYPCSGRRIAVLGAMKELGAAAGAEHRALGALAAGIADKIYAVGDEARSLLGSAPGTEVAWFEDAEAVTPKVRAALSEGDVVLVKGSRSVGLDRVVKLLAAL